MRVIAGSKVGAGACDGIRRERRYRSTRVLALFIAFIWASAVPIAAHGRSLAQPERSEQINEDFRDLFDAALDRIKRSFWNTQRLRAVAFEAKADAARNVVIGSADLPQAVARINDLLGTLGSSHTALLTPDDVMYHLLQDIAWETGKYQGAGFFSSRIGAADFVDAVLEGYPAARAGLKVGDEILAVDGSPYHPIRAFRDRAGSRASLRIRRHPDALPQDIIVEIVDIVPLAAFAAATRTSTRVIERGGLKIGYVHMWASVESSARALEDALPRLGIGWRRLTERLAEQPVDALVLDMRGKVGGFRSIAGRYLELLDPRGPILTNPKGVAIGSWETARGRNVALIDQGTRSTAELFAHSYRRERQGPLIGTRTAGAVSGGGLFRMPADCLLYVAVSGFSVDGEVLEGRGVAPDIEVPRPIPYADGADPVLEAGLDWLARNVKPRAAEMAPEGAASAQ